MLTPNLLRCYASLTNRRFFSRSAKSFESKASDATTKSSSSGAHSDSIIGPRMHATSSFDKWILTWMKKYPKGQVPDEVIEHTMYQTKSRARVKAANYMLVTAIVGCILGIYSGKKSVKEGDSIEKRNKDWHDKINKEHKVKIGSQS